MQHLFADHLANVIACGLVVLDRDGRIQLWNRWMSERCRAPDKDKHNGCPMLGQKLVDVLPGEVDQRVLLTIREALDFGFASLLSHALHPCPFPLYAHPSASERIKQSVTISPVNGDGGSRWCLIQINDVTSLVQREHLLRQQTRQLSEKLNKLTVAQEQLRRNEQRFRELARQAPVGIFETDLFGRVVFANERWQHMVGRIWDHNWAENWYDVVAGEDRDQIISGWRNSTASGNRYHGEFRCTNRSSMRKFWVSVDGMPVHTSDGAVSGYICTAQDIHEVKETSLRNAHQATFDALTGLYNRTPFNEQLDKALENAGDRQFCVLFVDLDGFKQVNDEHGHEAGDMVLKAVSRRLRRLLRPDDTIARFGGDEFVVLLAQCGQQADIDKVVLRVQRAVAQPINIGSCHVQLHCSVGTAMYPRDGADASALLNGADAQMYKAKFGKREGGDSDAVDTADDRSKTKQASGS